LGHKEPRTTVNSGSGVSHIWLFVQKGDWPGSKCYAINGYQDHVHIVVSIPPKIAVSKFVGQIKAVASVKYNQSTPNGLPVYWQKEFGAFSFDRKRLPNFLAYVQRQKEHHVEKKIIPALEREAVAEVIKEPTPVYAAEEEDWWHTRLEME
jgi:putative transposase